MRNNQTHKILLLGFSFLLLNACLPISTAHYVTPKEYAEKNHYRYIEQHHDRKNQDNRKLLMYDSLRNMRVYYDVSNWHSKGGEDLLVDLIFETDSIWMPNVKINNFSATLGKKKTPVKVDKSWLQLKYENKNNYDENNFFINERHVDLFNTNFKTKIGELTNESPKITAMYHGKTTSTIRIQLDKNLRSMKYNNLFLSFNLNIDGKDYAVNNVEYSRFSDFYVVTPLHVAFYAVCGIVIVAIIIFNDDET